LYVLINNRGIFMTPEFAEVAVEVKSMALRSWGVAAEDILTESWNPDLRGFPIFPQGGWQCVYVARVNTGKEGGTRMEFPFLYMKEECPIELPEKKPRLRRRAKKVQGDN
jgi:hypothetical protein